MSSIVIKHCRLCNRIVSVGDVVQGFPWIVRSEGAVLCQDCHSQLEPLRPEHTTAWQEGPATLPTIENRPRVTEGKKTKKRRANAH